MSTKNGINWRFSERSVYCYGGKQAMHMPCRIVFCHKTKRSFYGFLNSRLALEFLYERVPAADFVRCVKDGETFYYVIDDVILVSNRGVSVSLTWHYGCPVIDR